jgi:hypothetical protein
MASEKARELRTLLGVATHLRNLAEMSGERPDADLFLSVAQALEARAKWLAFGGAAVVPPAEKIDLVC